MGMIDTSVVRAHNMLLENADPETIPGALVQVPIIQDPQRAGREYRHFLENGAKLELVVSDKRLIDCRRASMSEEWHKANWQVEKHRNLGVQIFDPESVRLFVTEEQKRGAVKGDMLRTLLAEESILPDAYLDFYLANPEFIPESWKGKAVFFWGTIYRDPDGFLCVRYLYWSGDRWIWGYRLLVDGWNVSYPAAVLASN